MITFLVSVLIILFLLLLGSSLFVAHCIFKDPDETALSLYEQSYDSSIFTLIKDTSPLERLIFSIVDLLIRIRLYFRKRSHPEDFL